MQIYVVNRGDTIWDIARRFGVPYRDILRVNDIKTSTKLVIGQTLVIPSRERPYRLLPGDNLWSIGRKFGVSPEQIMALNKISNPRSLYVGQVIRIPEMSKRYGTIEANGFIQPSNPQRERNVLSESASSLTYVTPFSHHVNADGSLTPLRDGEIFKYATGKGASVLLSVTNITGTSGANFNTKLIDDILSSRRLTETLISNILKALESKGYKGVIIDFEKISPINRNKYNEFLRTLTTRLHPKYLVGTALAPKTYDVKTGAWHGAHDYKAHGEIVDFVVIMTYEWGWSGGPPMAVAPISEVRKVINYAVSVIPSRKIMMGVPLYGYDWTLPYVPNSEFAEAIGNQEAIDRAARFGAVIRYDNKAQSPHYDYVDKSGKKHEVWFEDARSVEAKYKMLNAYKLRGVSYWSLSKTFPQNWAVLEDMFQIKKY